MNCPSCNGKTQCKDSRDHSPVLRVRRYVCSCGVVINTHETIIEVYQGVKSPGRPKIVRLETKLKTTNRIAPLPITMSVNGYEDAIKESKKNILKVLEEREERKFQNNVVKMKCRTSSAKIKSPLKLANVCTKEDREEDEITKEQIRKNIEARHKLEDMKMDRELFFNDEFEYQDNASQETEDQSNN